MFRPMNLHRVVRIAEVGAILVLGGFAAMTYRELSSLRKTPVSLPSYQFDVSGETEASRVVSTRGTWITERGAPEELLTTTIECRKARMECVESDAKVVFVSGQGLLESHQTTFEVANWNEAGIITKPAQGKCATQQLVLDLRERKAISRIGRSEDKGVCRERPARTLELVTGYRLRPAD
jgi:hypothetical protein